ncbi:MAG: hypothetical protein U0232_24405 [Thermomicrobiales bacterium]
MQHIETRANMPQIARAGAAWLRAVGSNELPGSDPDHAERGGVPLGRLWGIVGVALPDAIAGAR